MFVLWARLDYGKISFPWAKFLRRSRGLCRSPITTERIPEINSPANQVRPCKVMMFLPRKKGFLGLQSELTGMTEWYCPMLAYSSVSTCPFPRDLACLSMKLYWKVRGLCLWSNWLHLWGFDLSCIVVRRHEGLQVTLKSTTSPSCLCSFLSYLPLNILSWWLIGLALRGGFKSIMADFVLFIIYTIFL